VITSVSGRALTQGVVNGSYSPAKTVADYFKYRRKLGIEVAVHALRASIRLNKCSRERLLHFANICRVGKLLRSCIPTSEGSLADSRNFSPLVNSKGSLKSNCLIWCSLQEIGSGVVMSWCDVRKRDSSDAVPRGLAV
jgi:hypothetical protein